MEPNRYSKGMLKPFGFQCVLTRRDGNMDVEEGKMIFTHYYFFKYYNEWITRNVFEIYYNRCSNNWCSDLKEMFSYLDLNNYFDSRMFVDTNIVVRKYVVTLFKTVFGRGKHVILDMPKHVRSILA